VFPGNYEDYLWRKSGKPGQFPAPEQNAAASKNGDSSGSNAAATVPAQPLRAEPPQKRVNPIKLKQMKDRCQDLEKEIARFEAAIADEETALQTFVTAEETRRRSDALTQHRSDLTACMAEWEELAQMLETVGEE
jgi:ATP-binding cassette, subfamily F, member 3